MSRPQPSLDQDALRMHAAGDAEPILGLGVDHGVPARHHPSRLQHLVGAALEDGRDDGLGHLAREAREVQREEDLASHGVDVGHGVGGGDGTEEIGVVHDGSEEIHGADYRHLVGDAIDSGIVALAETDEEIRMRVVAQALQHVPEISGTHLGCSAGAGGVAGETDRPAGLGIDDFRAHARGPRSETARAGPRPTRTRRRLGTPRPGASGCGRDAWRRRTSAEYAGRAPSGPT